MRKFWCVLMAGALVLNMQAVGVAKEKQMENSQNNDQIQKIPSEGNNSPKATVTKGSVQKSPVNKEFIVKYGSRGDDVKIVQNLLNRLGYPVGTIDGICGAMTVDAIKFFQKNNGLQENGVINEVTLQALKRAEPISSRGMRSMVMHATGYSAYDPGNGQYTSSGTFLRKGLVAVDPSVIPMGTKLYIPGYGNAVADDTGGAIRGNKIDLAFDSHWEALQFGRRDIMVYILN